MILIELILFISNWFINFWGILHVDIKSMINIRQRRMNVDDIQKSKKKRWLALPANGFAVWNAKKSIIDLWAQKSTFLTNLTIFSVLLFKTFFFFCHRTAAWSSGYGLWLVGTRLRVQFPVNHQLNSTIAVVLNLIGGTEPCKVHQCIQRTLPFPDFSQTTQNSLRNLEILETKFFLNTQRQHKKKNNKKVGRVVRGSSSSHLTANHISLQGPSREIRPVLDTIPPTTAIPTTTLTPPR